MNFEGAHKTFNRYTRGLLSYSLDIVPIPTVPATAFSDRAFLYREGPGGFQQGHKKEERKTKRRRR